MIIDGIGIEVEGHPLTDVSGLSRTELLAHSFHDPRKAPVPPGGGTGPSHVRPDAGRPPRQPRPPGPRGVGESDRIADPEYGKAFAAAIPASAFTVLPRTGHLPQVETPEELLGDH